MDSPFLSIGIRRARGSVGARVDSSIAVGRLHFALLFRSHLSLNFRHCLGNIGDSRCAVTVTRRPSNRDQIEITRLLHSTMRVRGNEGQSEFSLVERRCLPDGRIVRNFEIHNHEIFFQLLQSPASKHTQQLATKSTSRSLVIYLYSPQLTLDPSLDDVPKRAQAQPLIGQLLLSDGRECARGGEGSSIPRLMFHQGMIVPRKCRQATSARDSLPSRYGGQLTASGQRGRKMKRFRSHRCSFCMGSLSFNNICSSNTSLNVNHGYQ